MPPNTSLFITDDIQESFREKDVCGLWWSWLWNIAGDRYVWSVSKHYNLGNCPITFHSIQVNPSFEVLFLILSPSFETSYQFYNYRSHKRIFLSSAYQTNFVACYYNEKHGLTRPSNFFYMRHPLFASWNRLKTISVVLKL